MGKVFPSCVKLKQIISNLCMFLDFNIKILSLLIIDGFIEDDFCTYNLPINKEKEMETINMEGRMLTIYKYLFITFS